MRVPIFNQMYFACKEENRSLWRSAQKSKQHKLKEGHVVQPERFLVKMTHQFFWLADAFARHNCTFSLKMVITCAMMLDRPASPAAW